MLDRLRRLFSHQPRPMEVSADEARMMEAVQAHTDAIRAAGERDRLRLERAIAQRRRDMGDLLDSIVPDRRRP